VEVLWALWESLPVVLVDFPDDVLVVEPDPVVFWATALPINGAAKRNRTAGSISFFMEFWSDLSDFRDYRLIAETSGNCQKKYIYPSRHDLDCVA
jgi:hypothetical protein